MSDKELTERTKALVSSTVTHMIREYPELDLTNPELVVEYLQTIGKKTSTIRISLWALISYHKSNTPSLDLKKFREVYKKLTVELSKKTEKQTKEGKEHKSLEWPQVLQAAAKIMADDTITTEVKLLVSLYTELPPVRNDYVKLLIRKRMPSTDEGNYIVINGKRGEIVINEHKTAKEYGALKITLPVELRERMHAYVSENPDKTHLFNKDGSTISRWLGDAFEKYTGKRLTSTSLRHSYISEFRKGDKSLLEKKALARAMGHGLWLQELYREMD